MTALGRERVIRLRDSISSGRLKLVLWLQFGLTFDKRPTVEAMVCDINRNESSNNRSFTPPEGFIPADYGPLHQPQLNGNSRPQLCKSLDSTGSTQWGMKTMVD